MSYEEIYAKVRTGEMLVSEFVDWCIDENNNGYSEGRADAEENL